ncbi:MAG: helix-turn-helix domain-containing protein [Bacteroidales bacterium]|nr:helix-turn-helix domain-containing protein [Bacteroidales bacterium]
MVLTLSILGIILSAILLYFNARKYTSSIYLGIFFFLISLYGFIQYVVLFSKSVVLVGIVFTNVGFPTYLIGPVLYFYFRSVLSDNARLKKHDLWHLLPMVVYLAGTSEYLFTSWFYKMDIATMVINGGIKQVPFTTELGFLFKKLPLLVIYLSRPVLVMGYLLWSAGLLLRYKMLRMESMIFQQQHFMQKWLWILLGFLFVLVLSHSLQLVETFAVSNTAIFKTLNLLQIFSAIGLAGLLISPFFFPEILYGLPRLPGSVEMAKRTSIPSASLPTQESEKQLEDAGNQSSEGKPPTSEVIGSTSKFESNYLDFIEEQTEKYMQEFQPYLQQDFNLTQLSALVNIPVHHLAYYFREVKQISFTDFRNRWRIEHAKNLILEGKSSGLTLEAIGLLSGFTSRNTFLNAFKKAEGISPNAFLSQSKKS